ncbi:MAG: exosome complex protein Rrp42 [Candidatus Micrarchaeota archaeon]
MDVQEELNHQQVLSLLQKGKRADGRQKMEYREIEIEKNPLQNAEGSAICRMGKTQVIAGIKIDLATPFPDRPNEGVLSTGAEFTPLGSPHFEPGPPRVEAIEVARVVDRAVRSAEAIDLKSMSIEGSEKVIATYIDLWVIDHDGNLFDAGLMAAMAALKNTRMPKIEDGKIMRNEIAGKLDIKNNATSCTFAKYGEQFLLDPDFVEQSGAEGAITIATTPESMCSGQKTGAAGFTQRNIMELLDISFEQSANLRKIIEG